MEIKDKKRYLTYDGQKVLLEEVTPGEYWAIPEDGSPRFKVDGQGEDSLRCPLLDLRDLKIPFEIETIDGRRVTVANKRRGGYWLVCQAGRRGNWLVDYRGVSLSKGDSLKDHYEYHVECILRGEKVPLTITTDRPVGGYSTASKEAALRELIALPVTRVRLLSVE